MKLRAFAVRHCETVGRLFADRADHQARLTAAPLDRIANASARASGLLCVGPCRSRDLRAEKQVRATLVNAEPDQQQREDHEIAGANDEALQLEAPVPATSRPAMR